MTLTTVDNRLTHFKTRAAKGLARVIRQRGQVAYEQIVDEGETRVDYAFS